MKKLKLRDLVLGGMGAGILYHEVVLAATAEPLLIFAAFFLLGLVPASRADDDGGLGGPKTMLRDWLLKDENDDNRNDSSKTTKK